MTKLHRASVLCAGVATALAMTGCATDDDRPAKSVDIRTFETRTAVPQVDCSSGSVWEFGPARPGTAETMVPDAPLFAEVCRYDRPGGEQTPTPPPLTASGRIDGAELSAVVDAFNAAAGPTPNRDSNDRRLRDRTFRDRACRPAVVSRCERYGSCWCAPGFCSVPPAAAGVPPATGHDDARQRRVCSSCAVAAYAVS